MFQAGAWKSTLLVKIKVCEARSLRLFSVLVSLTWSSATELELVKVLFISPKLSSRRREVDAVHSFS